MNKTCVVCGKEFHVKPGRFERTKVCSRVCWDIYRPPRIKCTCAHCGKEFDRKPSAMSTSKSPITFCSTPCMHKYRELHATGETKAQRKARLTAKPKAKAPVIVKIKEAPPPHSFGDFFALMTDRTLHRDYEPDPCIRALQKSTPKRTTKRKNPGRRPRQGEITDNVILNLVRDMQPVSGPEIADRLNRSTSTINRCLKRPEILEQIEVVRIEGQKRYFAMRETLKEAA